MSSRPRRRRGQEGWVVCSLGCQDPGREALLLVVAGSQLIDEDVDPLARAVPKDVREEEVDEEPYILSAQLGLDRSVALPVSERLGQQAPRKPLSRPGQLVTALPRTDRDLCYPSRQHLVARACHDRWTRGCGRAGPGRERGSRARGYRRLVGTLALGQRVRRSRYTR
jgi:hypothetical protein